MRQFVLNTLAPETDLLARALMQMAIFARMGKFIDKPDEKTNGRALSAWQVANRRNIKVREFRLFGRPVDTYLAKHKEKTILFEGLPRPEGKLSESLDWMDSKSAVRKKFGKMGFPMARGGEAKDKKDALKLFRTLEKPVIVKPHVGSRSRHTTVDIKDERNFVEAVRRAKQLSPWVIIEEELSGFQYRVTLIGGKVTAVLRRDPPLVIGDGKRAIRELVREENKHPKRQGPIFHTIAENSESEAELAKQNFSWDSVPSDGKVVFLGRKASRGAGGGTRDETARIHPENRKLFETIGSFLNDPLVGVDFIIQDIAKPWNAVPRCGIIELNSLPFIDLHNDPLYGETVPIAEALWDIVFPKSKQF